MTAAVGRRSIFVVVMSALLAAAGNARGAGNRDLGEVRLTLQPVEVSGTATASAPPSLAVLLIDCSLSMNGPLEGTQQTRWDAMRGGVERLLETLLPEAGEPPIQVRLVFFATRLKCLPTQERTLGTREDVMALVESIPRQYPQARIDAGGGGTTHFYECTVKTLEQLRAENERRKQGWLLFETFSDGKDDKSDSGFDAARVEREKEALKREVPVFIDKVWLIGSQAKDAAASGQYGSAERLEIGEKPPKVPKPKPRYALALAPGQPVAVKAEMVATPGSYRLPVRVAGPTTGMFDGLSLTASIDGQSPFTLLRSDIALDKQGAGVVALELPAAGSSERGVSITLAFQPKAASESGAIFQGEPRVSVAFASSKTLSIDEWGMRYDREVKRGEQSMFVVNPGQHSAPRWTFRGPDKAELTSNDVAVAQAFPTAGQWTVEFSCTGDDEKPRRKPGDPVRVIDADFQLDPPTLTVGEGADATVSIKPSASAPAETTYSAIFNGQEVPIDGRTIRIPKSMLAGFGRHLLDVQSRYTPKAVANAKPFTWGRQATIVVSPLPRIALYPDEFVEGRDLGVQVHVFGDLGNAVTLLVDGQVFETEKYVYPPDTQVRELPRRTIPWKSITKPTIELEARSAKAGACPPEKVTLTARAADVSARLQSPVEGEVVPSGSAHDLVVAPVGNDCDAVGDVEFELAFECQGKRLPDTLVTRRATSWKAMMPTTLPTGAVDVVARPIGGNLNPVAFPEHLEFKPAGSFTIGTPELDIVQVTDAGIVPLGKASVPPGKPLTFQLDGAGIGRVRTVEWEIGPLAGDAELATEVRRAGSKEEARGQSITPKAWGELPVKAVATLDDGMRVSIDREVAVAGASPEAAPRLHPSNVFRLGAKTAALRPNVTGDFAGGRWALVDKGGTAVPNAWTSFTPAELEEQVSLPQDHFPGRHKDFDVLLEVDRYPGDPNHAPLAYRVPLILKAPSQWLSWLACVLLLLAITCLLLWWFDNPPLSWELLYGFDDDTPTFDHRESRGESLLVHDLGNEADRSPEAPARLAGRRGFRPAVLNACRSWSRRDKRIQIPMWKLADASAAPSKHEWLWEEPYANAIIELSTSKKWPLLAVTPRSVFSLLPGGQGDGAKYWHAPREVLPPVSGHSAVYRLRTREMAMPKRLSRPVWVCAKMRSGGDPWRWWVLIPWLVFAVVAAVRMARYFNM